MGHRIASLFSARADALIPDSRDALTPLVVALIVGGICVAAALIVLALKRRRK